MILQKKLKKLKKIPNKKIKILYQQIKGYYKYKKIKIYLKQFLFILVLLIGVKSISSNLKR